MCASSFVTGRWHAVAMDVDQWWDSLPLARKTQIMTWLDHTSVVEIPTPGQLKLLDNDERFPDAHNADV